MQLELLLYACYCPRFKKREGGRGKKVRGEKGEEEKKEKIHKEEKNRFLSPMQPLDANMV